MKIHIWDVEKGESLQKVTAPGWHVEDVRMSRDGSRIFYLYWKTIQVWSTQTGEVVGVVEFEFGGPRRFLAVDSSRVWVHSPLEEPQGWDFGIPGSSPVKLPNISSQYPDGAKLWDINQSRIKDTATGKIVFQMGGRFAKPFDGQWDGQYLVTGYESGEVLILDFNRVPL